MKRIGNVLVALLLATTQVYAADIKVSELPAASTVASADVFVGVQGSTTKKFPFSLFEGAFLEATTNYALSSTPGGAALTCTALAANPADCSAGQFATAIAASGALTCSALSDGDIPDGITVSLAGAATALAANGANCSAGQAPLGVDASGAAEGCWTVPTNYLADSTAYAGSATQGGAATTAVALAANGGNCTVGNYPLGVDASGAVESCTALPADDDVPESGDFGALALTGDVTSSGLATTIGANSVALGTDTTGDYVASATANQGLLLTGTEAGSLGLIDCAASQVLKRNVGDTAWECAADDSGAGGVSDGDKGDITVSGSGSTWNVDADSIALGTDTTGGYAASLTEGGAATTATALAADPADCAANQFATTIAASGALGCAALSDADIPNGITITLAAAATALAANGGNCTAGNYPLGVDASGAAESCTADDDVPDSGDFGALALTGDVTSSGLATTIAANSVALGTDTTGGYAASLTEGGAATTATALAANGSNCTAGNYPLGVDASGAVESCTADDDVPEAADYSALTAGRSLTAPSAGTIDADAELYTHTKCMMIESPAVGDDFLFFRAETAITITGIDCLAADGTSVAVLVKECNSNGGACGNTEASITCGTTNTTEASGIDDSAVDAGDWMRIDPGTNTGTVTQLSVCVTFTVND